MKSVGVKTLTRLQNEMQMLLYTHPFNDVRDSQRKLPVNSFWISGTGDLPLRNVDTVTPKGQVSAPRILAEAGVGKEWGAYAQA